MGTSSDIERSLRSAEQQREIYADNERNLAQQVAALHHALNDINQNEQRELNDIRQPFERNEQKATEGRKEFDRAREKFSQAEKDFRKVEAKFEEIQREVKAESDKARRETDVLVKKFNTERQRLEAKIAQTERDQREAAARRGNAEQDIVAQRRRLEEARKREMSASNDNQAPSTKRYGIR